MFRDVAGRNMKASFCILFLLCTSCTSLTPVVSVTSFCPPMPGRRRPRDVCIQTTTMPSDEECCSIDNLDACLGDGKSVEECSIESLDACLAEDTPEAIAITSKMNQQLSMMEESMEPFEYYDEGIEECSIDNLDACLSEGNSIEECCVDNLDACSIVEDPSDIISGGGGDMNIDRLFVSQQDSLRKFLSMPIIEVQFALLVLASSFLVGLGTLPALPTTISALSIKCELAISAVFTLEYLARWSLSGFSPKYVLQPLALIDLVAIIPGLIKILAAMGVAVPASLTGGALINLRLLRILRLQRVLVDYETFAKFELALGLNPSDAKKYQLELARIVISIFTLLSVTAGLIYSAEHAVNPLITDYFTALYFTLITLTTVGFGDISPVTVAGRWIVGGSILVASVILPAQAAALVDALLDRDAEGEQMKKGDGTRPVDDPAFSLDINSRLDRLEKKVEETNIRLERILVKLEDENVPADGIESRQNEDTSRNRR